MNKLAEQCYCPFTYAPLAEPIFCQVDHIAELPLLINLGFMHTMYSMIDDREFDHHRQEYNTLIKKHNKLITRLDTLLTQFQDHFIG